MEFACPQCKHFYNTHKAEVGMKARCKYCGQQFSIKKSRRKFVPPTERQSQLLRDLGISVPHELDKRQTTALISALLATEKYQRLHDNLPPTPRQLELAAELNVCVPKDATRKSLTNLLDEAIEAEWEKELAKNKNRDDRGRFCRAVH